MENFEIKMDSFDIIKLEKLRNILENNQIKKIINNIKSEDRIVIQYDKKTIKMNEKFYFRVELIRNKHYRKLLNIIDAVNNIEIYKTSSKKEIARIDPISIEVHGLKVLSSNYANILKRALINYIGVYNFDNIFELSKDEMLKLREYRCNNNNNNIEDISEALGMYCHYDDEVFRLLEPKVSKRKLGKMEKGDKVILICPQLIREFCSKHFDELKKYNIRNKPELYTIIFNKVLVHEIGHGVFDYLDDYENERRANYFVSLTFDGVFDKIIKKMTDIQGKSYRDPKLIDDDISIITNDVYNIK